MFASTTCGTVHTFCRVGTLVTCFRLAPVCCVCRERALAKVRVSAEDIAAVDAETEWGVDRSERLLREHGGDVAAALRNFAKP